MGVIKALRATRLTLPDMVILTLKSSLVVILCLSTNLIVGLVTSLIAFFVLEKFIQIGFGVEPLNATDKNVFYD